MSALPMTRAVATEAADIKAPKAQDLAIEISRLEQVLRTNPKDIETLLRTARLMQRAGRMEQASKLLTQAASLAPHRPDTIVAQAELLRAIAMHDEAIDLLQHAIETMPSTPVLWHAIGQTALELADLDKAGTSFDEALRLDPAFHLCRLQRAALYLRKGQARAALTDYEHLRQIAPNDPGILVGWGDAKTAMGDRAEARVAYSKALEFVGDPTPIVDRMQRLAVMEFSYPLQRTDLPSAQPDSDGAAHPDRIDVVFFHIDLATATQAPFEKPDYQAMLAHAAAVAKHRAPGARIVLLTDERTQISADLRLDRVVRSRIETVELMVDRLRLARDFLASGEAAENVVFLDTDVAVNRNPAEIFDGSFDVALTWRSDPPDNPFNAGVVLCRSGAPAVRFYDHLIASLNELDKYPAAIARFGSGGVRRWWGDQLAMAATVGWTEFARRRSDRLAVDGTVVRFLPADDYNLAISPNLPTPYGLDRRFFIHFKGSRKMGLARYARGVMGSRAPSPTASL